MSLRAQGSFEVSLKPEPPWDTAPGASLGRLAVSKQFRGDLEASSVGEMLAARTDIPASAGYVLLERVTGKLRGRAGSFVLQHSGTMNRGQPELTISVVPDSATSQLTGLAGRMTIEIIDGNHLYAFDYTLETGA